MSNSFKNRLFPVFFTLIFFIFLDGCNSTAKKNDNILNNNAMSMYAASVNSLKLPFKDTCDDTLAIQQLNLPDSLSRFQRYGQLIGKVKETKKYIAILYTIPADVQLPILHIFSKNGIEISSLKLFIGNCCGEDEECSGLSTVQITKDLHIILKDSMQTFERDKKKADKKRNIKILKKQAEFKIDSTGNILPISPLG